MNTPEKLNRETSTSNASISDELKQDASQLKDTATSQAEHRAKQASQKAASAAHSTSSALRDAGDKLEHDDAAPSWLGSAFKQAAESIAELADTVEGKEPREIMRDVSKFGRNNPTAFLAGAALAGFSAARVMKAGTQQSDASLSDIDSANGNAKSQVGGGTTATSRNIDPDYARTDLSDTGAEGMSSSTSAHSARSSTTPVAPSATYQKGS